MGPVRRRRVAATRPSVKVELCYSSCVLIPPTPNEKYRNWGQVAGVFSGEECGKIVALFGELPREEGGVNATGPDPKKRRSTIAWLRFSNPGCEWIYKRLWEKLKEANDTFYKYDLTQMQSIQLTEYATGEHYTWHSDMSFGRNSLRKLSASLQLSDPASYEGGDLVLRTHILEKAPRAQGTLVFFPSFIFHCVEPVTRGTRYALVCWVQGPPLR
jgi:PKHD-type hydroxylase